MPNNLFRVVFLVFFPQIPIVGKGKESISALLPEGSKVFVGSRDASL